jgi:hypothetical protein
MQAFNCIKQLFEYVTGQVLRQVGEFQYLVENLTTVAVLQDQKGVVDAVNVVQQLDDIAMVLYSLHDIDLMFYISQLFRGQVCLVDDLDGNDRISQQIDSLVDNGERSFAQDAQQLEVRG